jgi:ribonuclease D
MTGAPSLDDLPPPVLVQDEAALARMLGVLERMQEIAFDTEADSFFHYREKVCLIQVSAGGCDWLVDPLAEIELAPLGAVLADPARVKVFHDGEYDVLLLKRDFGFSFASLFDTRVAAAALGDPSPGLAAVLEREFGVVLDKSMQRSDWSRRPLSQRQITYARLDTRFLVQLMQRQREALRALDREEVLEGECLRLAALPAPGREFDPDEWVRVKGARTLDPAQRRALRELFVWRDTTARRRDVPPFKVLGNGPLLALAEARPTSPRSLARIEGFPPKVARILGPELLAVLRRAEEEEPIERLPKLPSRDGTGELGELELELHERLKSWRKERATTEEMDASLVLNRLALLALAKERPASGAALEALPEVQPWQVRRYGDDLLATIARFDADARAGRVPLPRGRRSRRRSSSDRD